MREARKNVLWLVSYDKWSTSGDVLSPTLFNIFLNNLAVELKDLGLGININNRNICILLYADDIVLLSDNELNLQRMLDHMYNWCIKWRLKINETKTNVMHFRGKNVKATAHPFKFGDISLTLVERYKYLGVFFDKNLTFEHGVGVLCDSGGRALGGVISKFKQLKDVGFKTFQNLFFVGVKPILEYGAGVWGFGKYQQCDIIQNRAMRYFLGVHRLTPVVAMQGDMGWLPMRFNRLLCMLRLWNRFLSLDDNRLTKFIFNYDWNLQNKNWSAELHDIFTMCDFSYIFRNKLKCNLNDMKAVLHNIASVQWRNEVELKPKLRFYKLLKSSIRTEDYITGCLPRYRRSLFAQLRFGVLPLRIETGRFVNLVVEERLCPVCDLGVVEDEIHFILHCPLYTNLRTNLFNSLSVDISLPLDHVLNALFSNYKVFGYFVENAFVKRKNTLFN